MTLSGDQMVKLVDEIKLRYATTRQRLMKDLRGSTPYGQVKLTPAEQYARFQDLTPEDWNSITAQLENQFRGLPNQQELVDKEIQDYILTMLRRRQTVEGEDALV